MNIPYYAFIFIPADAHNNNNKICTIYRESILLFLAWFQLPLCCLTFFSFAGVEHNGLNHYTKTSLY